MCIQEFWLIHSIAHAIFKTPALASAALAKLHSHLYKGTILSVVLKKRSDSLIKGDPAHPASDAPKPSRGGRLIIRNLPWNVRFQLKSFFLITYDLQN